MSCGIALAVFNEIEERQLRQAALEVGGYLVETRHKLAKTHDLIGDVRCDVLLITLQNFCKV